MPTTAPHPPVQTSVSQLQSASPLARCRRSHSVVPRAFCVSRIDSPRCVGPAGGLRARVHAPLAVEPEPVELHPWPARARRLWRRAAGAATACAPSPRRRSSRRLACAWQSVDETFTESPVVSLMNVMSSASPRHTSLSALLATRAEITVCPCLL
eukprot:1945336-Pleurochrysis_carterae.AAC.2